MWYSVWYHVLNLILEDFEWNNSNSMYILYTWIIVDTYFDQSQSTISNDLAINWIDNGNNNSIIQHLHSRIVFEYTVTVLM